LESAALVEPEPEPDAEGSSQDNEKPSVHENDSSEETS
jgi:hypothetical protein